MKAYALWMVHGKEWSRLLYLSCISCFVAVTDVSRGQNDGSLRQERAFHGNAFLNLLDNDRGLPKNEAPQIFICILRRSDIPKSV